MGAKVDVVCKCRGKEAQERAEKDGGAHRGQSEGVRGRALERTLWIPSSSRKQRAGQSRN